VVPRHELPHIYSAADCFVFPGRSETFGLVMLEALACGTPVAAYPVAGPLDVIGDSPGGVLDDNLQRAALRALQVPREAARERALAFGWDAVCEQFLAHLVRLAPNRGRAAIIPASGLEGHENVTRLS
jgi:glycosyltransferase involved in cell wall biosynthesis